MSARRAEGGPAEPSPAPAPTWVWMVLGALASGVLAWIIYAEGLHAPFVYDDVLIEECSHCHPARPSELLSVLGAKGVPRKLTLLSFALNHALGGPDTYGYHLVNLALHATVAVVLFGFAARLLALLPATRAWASSATPIAAAGAVTWLVHPVQTQAVVYIWQRSTELAALFFLASLWAYLEARWGRRRPRALLLAAAAVCALLAANSKENAAALPLFVLLLESAFRPPRLDRRSWAVAGGLLFVFASAAAFYLGPRFLTLWAGEYQRRGFTPGERLLTQARVVVRYLTLLAVPLPSRLNLDYDIAVSRSLLSPPTTLASLAVVAVLLAAAIRWRGRLVSLGCWRSRSLAVRRPRFASVAPGTDASPHSTGGTVA